MTSTPTERNQNHSRLLTPEALANNRVLVIGAGAIGSFAVLALTKMGFTVETWDDDTIENHNFANQMFPVDAIGKNKAVAIAEVARAFSGEIVTAIPARLEAERDIPTNVSIFILAVDSMAARKKISEMILKKNDGYIGDHGPLIIDARMGGQNFRVYSAQVSRHGDYAKTLYTDDQAAPDICGQKSIIYTVLGCVAEVCNSARRKAMGLPVTFEVFKNYNVPEQVVVHSLIEEEVAA